MTQLLRSATAERLLVSIRPRRGTMLCRAAASALAAALLAAPAAAQTRARASRAASSERLAMDPATVMGTLPNGIRYYIRPNAHPAHRAELRLVVDAGSALEDSTQRGLAHFVEHMAFNGTTHFKKLEIVRYLESMGMQFGADLNAQTTFDATTYRFTIPTDRPEALGTGLRILADWAHGITFDSAAVEAERGIILGEWRSRTDAGGIGSRITERYYDDLLRGSRYADRMPIGLPSIIEHAPRSAIVRFYRDWYRPDRMAVIVVGDIDAKATVALIRRELGGIPRAAKGRARPSLDVPMPTAPSYAVVADSQVGDPSATVAYRIPPLHHGTRDGFHQGLVDRMVSYIVSERLSDLGRGTIGIEEPVRDVRTYTLRATTYDGDVNTALAKLLGTVQQVVEHGFTTDELERVRTFTMKEFDDALAGRDAVASATLADGYAQSFLTGAVLQQPRDATDLAGAALSGPDAIGLDELNAAARAAFSPARRVILAAASPKAKAPLPTEASLARMADSVARASTPTYASEVQSIPLVAVPPVPGRVDSTRALAAIGAQEWVLSNGVHVILKPTGYDADQLLVEAMAPGGYSLATDSDYVSARLATQALATSGLGALTLPLLQKRLRSTASSVTLTPFINELSEGLTAKTAPRDAETLFQMIHLLFTAPRADPAAIARWRQTTREQLRTGQAELRQAIQAIVMQNNPRGRPITAAMVDSLDPVRALAFQRARFADASAFTFYIVGAFDPDSIRPLVERWLASLPATHAHETWRDLGVRPLAGPENINAPVGSAGKTSMELVLTGAMPFDAESTTLLTGIAEVAEMRLLDRLRTQMHATYGVQVAPTGVPWPYPHFEIDVSFDAAPEQADSLANAAIAVLDTLRASGPTPQEVDDVKELLDRRLELGRRDNGYWLSTLAMDGWNGWAPGTGIVDGDTLLGAITAERLKAAAGRFLDTAHVVRIAIRPRPTTS